MCGRNYTKATQKCVRRTQDLVRKTALSMLCLFRCISERKPVKVAVIAFTTSIHDVIDSYQIFSEYCSTFIWKYMIQYEIWNNGCNMVINSLTEGNMKIYDRSRYNVNCVDASRWVFVWVHYSSCMLCFSMLSIKAIGLCDHYSISEQ